MITLGISGWADKVENLKIEYDGSNGCWLCSGSEAILQAGKGHEKSIYQTFLPFIGTSGLLFYGGHRSDKYGLKADTSYGGIYFVRDNDPERYHNSRLWVKLAEKDKFFQFIGNKYHLARKLADKWFQDRVRR